VLTLKARPPANEFSFGHIKAKRFLQNIFSVHWSAFGIIDRNVLELPPYFVARDSLSGNAKGRRLLRLTLRPGTSHG
jgi:hypothetical protein